MTGPRPDAAAGAGAAADLVARICTRIGLPRSDSWNHAGSGAPKSCSWVCDERRDDDGPLGGDRLDVLEGHVADELGLGEVAERGEPLAELPRGPAGQLLHPAHAQPQRLAEDAVVVARCPRRSPRWMARRLGGQLGAGATRGGASASTTGLRSRISSSVRPVLAGLGQHPQRDRRAGHPVAAGVGEHAHEDLVRVQRTEDRLAAVQQAR